MRLVVGLGNPGAAYALTRHNIGAQVVQRAAERWCVSWQRADGAPRGTGRVCGCDVILSVCPAWMNHSGPAVRALLDGAGLGPDALIVVHDDLDLPLGRLRIRRRGGAGGHRGVLSLLAALDSDAFCRLKIGIGSPPEHLDPADYVLAPFETEERAMLEPTVARSVAALECVIAEGPEAAMNRFNMADPDP